MYSSPNKLLPVSIDGDSTSWRSVSPTFKLLSLLATLTGATRNSSAGSKKCDVSLHFSPDTKTILRLYWCGTLILLRREHREAGKITTLQARLSVIVVRAHCASCWSMLLICSSLLIDTSQMQINLSCWSMLLLDQYFLI